MSKKCIAVHLPTQLYEKINEVKSKTGQSQSGLIINLLEEALGKTTIPDSEKKLYFFIKVKIDITKIKELGEKLQSGELDSSNIIMTYCIKNDPTVGLSFWQADTFEDFNKTFEQFKIYYSEVIDVIQVVTSMQSLKLIMESLNNN